VDLLRNSGCFTREEAQEYIDIGVLNGLFVLGRTIGFIGKNSLKKNSFNFHIICKIKFQKQVITWIRNV
jgi:hypothetical protein